MVFVWLFVNGFCQTKNLRCELGEVRERVYESTCVMTSALDVAGCSLVAELSEQVFEVGLASVKKETNVMKKDGATNAAKDQKAKEKKLPVPLGQTQLESIANASYFVIAGAWGKSQPVVKRDRSSEK